MKKAKAKTARAPSATPIPMPALAPDDRPEDGAVVGDGVDVDVEVGMDGVELEVAPGRSEACQLI
jgi:hypothetical protein